jgi:hypothetical protein
LAQFGFGSSCGMLPIELFAFFSSIFDAFKTLSHHNNATKIKKNVKDNPDSFLYYILSSILIIF